MLSSQIESILFVSNKPLSLNQLAKICGTRRDEIEVALESLRHKYNQDNSGVNIIEHNNEAQMVVRPENSQIVKALIKEEIDSELTRPQLEALTIIAYRGPITKLELEQIRGVNCGIILRNLLIKGLVEVKEDKIIDNNTYNISIEFMKHLGIKAVEELPDYDELSKAEELSEAVEEIRN